MATKRLTKCAIRGIAETVSEQLPATFAKDVLKRTSAAKYVTTFADRVAFMEMLQQHKDWRTSLRSLTGPNPPLLSWSFHVAGVAGVPETSLQFMSKSIQAA